VHEHQLLATTGAIDYAFERVRGISNMFLGGSGFCIDRFHSNGSDGISSLRGYGNVYPVDPSCDQSVLVRQ
jgi:uncharacterized protein (AIM24 family)